MLGRYFLLCVCMGFAFPASASPWVMDKEASKLTFEGKQGSNTFEGNFSKFDVTIDFDETHPEKGNIKATIDVSSASAGSKERDDFLPQVDWFNTATYPTAQFVSTELKHVGADKDGVVCYTANGKLTIKDVMKPITLDFCLRKEGDHYRAQGKVPLLRNDYHVGVGEWGVETYVKYAVDVTVDLSVKPKSAF